MVDTNNFPAQEVRNTLSAATLMYAEGRAAEAVALCVRVLDLTDRPEDLAAAALLVHGISGEFNGLLAGLCDKVLARIPTNEQALRARVEAQRAHVIGELLLGDAATGLGAATYPIKSSAPAPALGFGPIPVAWSNGGLLLLASGDLDLARTCFERLRPVLSSLSRDGRWLYTVVGAAELAITFADADIVGWCLTALVPYAGQYLAAAGGTIACLGSVAGTLGRLAEAEGDRDAAAAYFAQSAKANERLGAVPYQVLDELALARVLLKRGRAGDLPAARDLAARAGGAARRLGMTSSRAQAVEFAETAHRAVTADVGLTRRERDIVALLAHGASNRSMAVTLVVSERTVESHVANIMAKLRVANRTEAATWALRNGLGTSGDEAR